MGEFINKALGQFQITRELGHGGMAIVYEAYQPALQRKVAIKVLSPGLSSDTGFVRRFQQEAVAAAGLRHPNIVTIHDVGSQDRYNYIVMEYLEGRPLSDVIRATGPMPLTRVCKIIEQVAQALDYAHQHGFIHRDIKPSNIMVRQDDHATLTDFGIARALTGTHLTQTGTMVGTPEYMSPEQVMGGEVDARTDVYSLGIVAYEMVTGAVPFSGTTASVLFKQANTAPPPVHSRVPGVSPAVEEVILHALAKRCDERFFTAGHLAQALATAVSGQPVGSPAGVLTSPTVSAPTPQLLYTPPPANAPQPAYMPLQPAYGSQPAYTPLPDAPRSAGLPRGLLWLLGGVGVAFVLCLVAVGAFLLWGRQPLSTFQVGSVTVVPQPITVVVSATPANTLVPNLPSTSIPTLTPRATPALTSRVTPALDPDQIQRAVQDAVEHFQKAKEYSQKTGDTSRLPQDLAGLALDRQIQLVNQTKAENCYWDIWLDTPMRYEILETRGDSYVRVKVFKTETRHKYCNGKLAASNSVDRETYDTTYTVEQVGGKWYVTERE
jgi:serine/threonine-protein kinase